MLRYTERWTLTIPNGTTIDELYKLIEKSLKMFNLDIDMNDDVRINVQSQSIEFEYDVTG